MKRSYALLLMVIAFAGLMVIAIFALTGDGFSRAAPMPAIIDEGEPNDTFEDATQIAAGDTAIGSATNDPITATDFFSITTTPGYQYRVSFQTEGGGNLRLKLLIYDETRAFLDDSAASVNSGNITWTSYGSMYFIELQPAGLTTGTVPIPNPYDYTLQVVQIAATPTPTPQPTSTSTPEPTATPDPGPTPIPGADQFEPNFDFGHAATIGTGVTYSANFIPWNNGQEDNDYFKVWIKPGLNFICQTMDLAPGLDTNIIVYDQNYNAVGGNDDRALGDYSSEFAYFSTYEGWLYILVGHGGRFPYSEVENSDYSFRCDKEVPGATETPTPQPTSGPQPTSSATEPPPTATPEPENNLSVRPLATPTPGPSGGSGGETLYPEINVLVYYDANNDNQPGAGEGISGISIQIYDAETNQVIAQGLTDDLGNRQFTIAARGTMRVSIPYFGFSQLIAGDSGASVQLRIPPQTQPGGTQ